jgi:hypothetical protein
MGFLRGMMTAAAAGVSLVGVAYPDIVQKPAPTATSPETHAPVVEDLANPNCQQLKVGNYKPLDYWSKLKLGTAYYVNPGLVQHTSILYLYPPTAPQNPEAADQFVASLADAKLTLAKLQPSGNIAVLPTDTTRKIVLNATHTVKSTALSGQDGANGLFTKALLGELAKSKYEIAATSDDIYGVRPSQTVISFDAATRPDCPTPK